MTENVRLGCYKIILKVVTFSLMDRLENKLSSLELFVCVKHLNIDAPSLLTDETQNLYCVNANGLTGFRFLFDRN